MLRRGRGSRRGQRGHRQMDQEGKATAGSEGPQAQGSPDRMAELHGSRRQGYRKRGSSVVGDPPGSRVLLSAAFLAGLS